MRPRLASSLAMVAVIGGIGAFAGAHYLERRVLEAERRLALARTESLKRLEAEVQKLKEIQLSEAEIARLLQDRAMLEKVRAGLAAAQLPRPESKGAGPVLIVGHESASSEWSNVGQTSPLATLETALWAGRNGQIDVLAPLLVFDERAKVKAAELFARLPAAEQKDYGSPEQLVALFTARDAAYDRIQVRSEVTFGQQALESIRAAMPGVQDMRILRAVTHVADQPPQDKNLTLRQYEDGWHLVVPEAAIDKYSAQLAALR